MRVASGWAKCKLGLERKQQTQARTGSADIGREAR
jgi:hypothetical protein